MSASAPRRPLLTVDDLLALGDDVRAELIHGEILPKALPREAHSHGEGSLGSWLYRRFNRDRSNRWPGGWHIRPEIHVVYDPHQVFCHDLAGWRRDRVARFDPGWVYVRPDWVCELLSAGHEKRDRIDKMGVMHAAGVPYYWIVNFEEKLLHIYRNEPAGYLLIGAVSTGQIIHADPFEEVELRTSVLFGDEDDED